MVAQFARAPHRGRSNDAGIGVTSAALLIDFDNVTMGIRSDLSKEIKKLLSSEVIKGKVAVQRAYADWRRYPQYIVPLSEASVDLIFAPAYGSSKKNATDIRLAIDALELVFTRPEISTFILLSGDSDFSSLVLKLKEYGKYVIGVGMRESSSDLLVQNCDEYFSYSALAGLTRAGEEEGTREDPFVLVERALDQMVARGDVMRSDRLKQVMLELDPNFDEKEIGFRKFSRFLTEAVSRGIVNVRKLENGQFEIAPGDGAAAAAEKSEVRRGRGRRDRGRREERAAVAPVAGPPPALAEVPDEQAIPEAEPGAPPAVTPAPEAADDPLARAYDLLRRAASELIAQNGAAPRDSDVKRRMLEMQPSWTESELGFSKFSRFLRQAHDAEVIDLRRTDNGSFEVLLTDGPAPAAEAHAGRRKDKPPRRDRRRGRDVAPAAEPGAEEAEAAAARETPEPAGEPAAPEPKKPPEPETRPAETAAAGSLQPRGLRFRRGTRGRHTAPPPQLLAGQTVAEPGKQEPAAGGEPAADAAATEPKKSRKRKSRKRPAGSGVEAPLADRLGLPTDPDAIVRYVTDSYRGVGRKTAERLVEEFGAGSVFAVLEEEPGRVRELLDERRADALLNAWSEDRQRRAGDAPPEDASGDGAAKPATRSGGRGRSRGRPGGRGGHGSGAKRGE